MLDVLPSSVLVVLPVLSVSLVELALDGSPLGGEGGGGPPACRPPAACSISLSRSAVEVLVVLAVPVLDDDADELELSDWRLVSSDWRSELRLANEDALLPVPVLLPVVSEASSASDMSSVGGGPDRPCADADPLPARICVAACQASVPDDTEETFMPARPFP